jgi:hypothetical protein
MEEKKVGSTYTQDKKPDKNPYAHIRCYVCNKYSDNPIVRKTCCVNKLYVFCSEACLRSWYRKWLRRQEQIKTKNKKVLI